MSKYGSGVSFDSVCKYEKEAILKALEGQKVVDETEDGFVYGECDKEEAKQIILDAFEEVCYQAKQAFAFGRAQENFLKEKMGEKWYAEYSAEFIHSGMIEKESMKEDK